MHMTNVLVTVAKANFVVFAWVTVSRTVFQTFTVRIISPL